MHHSGTLPLTFEGPEQGLRGKNCQNENQGKPCCSDNGPAVILMTAIDQVCLYFNVQSKYARV